MTNSQRNLAPCAAMGAAHQEPLDAANHARQAKFDADVAGAIAEMQSAHEADLASLLHDLELLGLGTGSQPAGTAESGPPTDAASLRRGTHSTWTPSIGRILRKLGRGDGGREFARVRAAILRLRAAEVLPPSSPRAGA